MGPHGCRTWTLTRWMTRRLGSAAHCPGSWRAASDDFARALGHVLSGTRTATAPGQGDPGAEFDLFWDDSLDRLSSAAQTLERESSTRGR
jgi:hypothetical protein